MSRNNLVLVICHEAKYYVVPNVNACTQWNFKFARNYVKVGKYMRNRGNALILAHNIQLKIQTEFGVRELYLWDDVNKNRY